MYLCQLGARRQIGIKLCTSDVGSGSFHSLFGVPQIPHGDTLAYLCKRINAQDLSEIPSFMANILIRKRVFEDQRLLGTYYLVAIDGTGTFRFKHRHCPYCLTCTHSNGETHYYHNVLEAKLVTPSGFAISLVSELIENKHAGVLMTDEARDKVKQDCELKAFYRLEKKLKNRFKRLKICLVLDALFANGKVFDLCRANAWAFLITMQDDQLSSINDEFYRLLTLNPKNQLTRTTGKHKQITQNFAWMTDISYVDSWQQTHYLNVLECTEFKPRQDKQENPIRVKSKFKWLTNLHLNQDNVITIANQGGRQRWKIENQGFNIQKNGGYGLKHAYSENPNAFEAFYYLMQIAHTIAQLIQRGSLLKKIFPKGPGSLGHLAYLILEAIRNFRITPSLLHDINSSQVQIRFDTS